MRKSGSMVALGLGIVLAFWLCLVIACFALATLLPERDGDGLLPPEATPGAQVGSRPPNQVERETARRVAESTVPARDLLDLGQRLGDLTPAFEPALPSPSPSYSVGDTLDFSVHDIVENSSFTATAVLAYATEHAYWWVQVGYDVPADDLAASARTFEEKTYPTNRRLFGSERSPGIDGDEHIYIFLGDVPGVGGYFSPQDSYPRAIVPRSNQHEMFYVNMASVVPGTSFFDGVLAHEFQHMIHWAEDADEVTWVNEGLAELAAHANGYSVGDIDYAYTQSPDTQLTAWSELDTASPHYGAAYLFFAYVHEQYGDEAIRRLVAEPQNGIAGINALLAKIDPQALEFEDLLADWMVATYLDDPRIANGRFGYAGIDVDTPLLVARHSRYPAGQQAGVHQHGADYYELQGKGTVTVEISGSTLVPLIGNQVRSGTYQWWSNRADEADSRLTQAFDLTGLSQATLQAWLWYELEMDYDYAYVEVSTDGGRTWTLLDNEHTTTTNPSGNSYGPALTGTSGGRQEPDWVQHRFDLTPFAGRPVLVRFEVITDEELNYRGLAIDDVSIPELGYAHDAETDGGWQAEGFLRVGDRVPQQMLVQLILEGRGTHVERVPLDEKQRGQIVIAGLGTDVRRAVLVITGLQGSTTIPAVYEYRITPAAP